MKNFIVVSSSTLAFLVTPLVASASPLGTLEDIRVVIDARKLDTSLPASQRFGMLERLAERICDKEDPSLQARKFERACEVKLKRSILSQVGDEALKNEARNQGVLD